MSETHKGLFDSLVRESSMAFKEIISQHTDVYVLGLYHMGGFDGVFPMFNTLSQVPEKPMANAPEERFIEYYDAMWAPTDYPMLEDYSDRLPDSEDILRSMPHGNMDSQWDSAINAMVMAMKAVSKVLPVSDVDVVPVFYVATYDETWSERISRIRLINTPDVLDRILPDFEFMEGIQAKWQKEAWDEIHGNE